MDGRVNGSMVSDGDIEERKRSRAKLSEGEFGSFMWKLGPMCVWLVCRSRIIWKRKGPNVERLESGHLVPLSSICRWYMAD
jgi:hypothetical protein